MEKDEAEKKRKEIEDDLRMMSANAKVSEEWRRVVEDGSSDYDPVIAAEIWTRRLLAARKANPHLGEADLMEIASSGFFDEYETEVDDRYLAEGEDKKEAKRYAEKEMIELLDAFDDEIEWNAEKYGEKSDWLWDRLDAIEDKTDDSSLTSALTYLCEATDGLLYDAKDKLRVRRIMETGAEIAKRRFKRVRDAKLGRELTRPIVPVPLKKKKQAK